VISLFLETYVLHIKNVLIVDTFGLQPHVSKQIHAVNRIRYTTRTARHDFGLPDEEQNWSEIAVICTQLVQSAVCEQEHSLVPIRNDASG